MIRGWDPILPRCGGTSMALFSTHSLGRVSCLWHGFGQPISCQNCIQIVSQQLGWVDGCQNCLGAVPRPRLGAVWDPVFCWLWHPAPLPMGQGGAEALWIALPN